MLQTRFEGHQLTDSMEKKYIKDKAEREANRKSDNDMVSLERFNQREALKQAELDDRVARGLSADRSNSSTFEMAVQYEVDKISELESKNSLSRSEMQMLNFKIRKLKGLGFRRDAKGWIKQ